MRRDKRFVGCAPRSTSNSSGRRRVGLGEDDGRQALLPRAGGVTSPASRRSRSCARVCRSRSYPAGWSSS